MLRIPFVTFVFKFDAFLETISFRKEVEINEAEILLKVFDDNISDVENEHAVDSFEDCEDDPVKSDF